jgi:adenine-specific DNA-methyltransferase
MAQNNSHFDINNRKYLGSKNRLLGFLERVVLRNASNKIGVFLDIFSGTGVVANHFRKFSNEVIANDILYSNFVINKVFLNSTKRNVRVKKMEGLIKNLNTLKPIKGYCYKNFGDTYFTKGNASHIDAIREKIEELKNDNKITTQEYYVLLTSLVFAVDKVANTVGQYDAFLKHIGEESYSKKGRHLVDSNIYKKIELKMPVINFDGNNKVFNEDANSLIRKIECDVLYLDPPYNHRQYVDSYHVLENILRWEKPKVYGKTKKFERDYLKSKYSQRGHATYIFEDLINNAKCKHIFLSYNNEGIIPDSDISRILKNKGKLKMYKTQYNIFGNGAGQSKKRSITERVFYCKVK